MNGEDRSVSVCVCVLKVIGHHAVTSVTVVGENSCSISLANVAIVVSGDRRLTGLY